MCAERLAFGLAVLGLVLCTACGNDKVSSSSAIPLSGGWQGTTTPTGHASFATNWTMSLGPTGDGSQVQASGGCTYGLSGNSAGTYRLLGQFDGSFMSLSGNPLDLDLTLEATVIGDSLIGSYRGSSSSPCFVYSGTLQGTKQ